MQQLGELVRDALEVVRSRLVQLRYVLPWIVGEVQRRRDEERDGCYEKNAVDVVVSKEQ